MVLVTQLSRFLRSDIISINTSVFTVRVLSRPQHGMWPTRWLHGPFLFPNHLILCLLRWKCTPLKHRTQEPKPLGVSSRERLDVWCFLKETSLENPCLESLWNHLKRTATCSCCEITDWRVAWQTCFVDHAFSATRCCGEDVHISGEMWSKLTYVLCVCTKTSRNSLDVTDCNKMELLLR